MGKSRPWMVVRRLVHRLGYRYRLHVGELPDRPDMVLVRHRKIIDVRGCFWHWHGCPRSRMPATQTEYWTTKVRRNQERDRAAARALRRGGWRVLVVWECETAAKGLEKLRRKLTRFLAE